LVARSAEVAGAQGIEVERESVTTTAVLDRVLANIVDKCQSRTAAVSF
jgi:hypothetical protein